MLLRLPTTTQELWLIPGINKESNILKNYYNYQEKPKAKDFTPEDLKYLISVTSLNPISIRPPSILSFKVFKGFVED